FINVNNGDRDGVAPCVPPFPLSLAYRSTVIPPIPTTTYPSNLPSYPVYVDPNGYSNPYNPGPSGLQYWVGGANPTTGMFDSIPRRSMWSIAGAPGLPNPAPPIYQLLYPLPPQGNLAARNTRFVQMDDVAIGRDGTVIDPSGNTYGTTGQPVNNVQRDGRYS